MTSCNYIALDTDNLDPFHPYLDDLFDLDLLCTDEGIFINIPSEE